jgi:predicted transcriptional regulator
VTARDHTSNPRKHGGNERKPASATGSVTSRVTTPDHARRAGEGGRLEAARLHSEGLTVSDIARRLGVARETVSRWVHHKAVEAVAAERAARAAEHRDAVAAARETLRAAAERAAAVLVAQLEDSDPAVASAAARTLLDRVGVPRAEVVQTAPSPLDLSGLSAAELDSLEGLLSRVGGGQ